MSSVLKNRQLRPLFSSRTVTALLFSTSSVFFFAFLCPLFFLRDRTTMSIITFPDDHFFAIIIVFPLASPFFSAMVFFLRCISRLTLSRPALQTRDFAKGRRLTDSHPGFATSRDHRPRCRRCFPPPLRGITPFLREGHLFFPLPWI